MKIRELGWRLEFILFWVFLLVLGLYAILTGRGFRIPTVFFWGGFLSSLFIFLFQCFNVARTPRRLIFFEMSILIVVHSFLFWTLTPAHFPFSDSAFTVDSSTRIAEQGWPLAYGSAPSTVKLVSDWPAPSVVAGILRAVGGLEWVSIFGLLPSILHCLINLSVFLFSLKVLGLDVHKSAILGIVAPLSFGIIMTNVLMNVGMGTPLLFFSIYLVGSNHALRDTRRSTLTLIVFIALVLTHHLSSFYLLLICTFFFAYPRLSARRFAHPESRKTDWLTVSGLLLVYLLVIVFLYWTFIGQSVLLDIYRGLIGISTLEPAPSGGFFAFSKNTIVLFVDGLCAVLMTLLVLPLRRENRERGLVNFYWSLFWFSVILVGIVFLSSRIRNAGLELSRSLGVAWSFFIMSFLGIRIQRTTKTLGIVIVCVFLLFCCNQLNRYDGTSGMIQPWGEPRYSNQGYVWGGIPSDEDLEAVLWYPQQEPIVGDQTIYSLAEGWKNTTVYVLPDVFRGNISATGSVRWLFLRELNFKFVFCPYQQEQSFGVSNSTLAAFEGHNKVFDNGGVGVYDLLS